MNKKILIGIIIALAIVGIYMMVGGRGIAAGQRNKNIDDTVYVYETAVDGPDECSSYEEYDTEIGACYFECDTEQECSEIEDLVNDELESWADDAGSVSEESEDAIEDSKPVVSYRVSAGEKITVTQGKDSAQYRDIWSDIAELSPDAISNNYIDTFKIHNSKDSDSIAFVDEGDNGKWNIAVNIGVYNELSLREQKSTLIHELGHIISLNNKQAIQMKNCTWYLVDEGCATRASYIGAFWGTFYKGQRELTYTRQKFVTEYAATDPVEDWAESFAAFVFGTGPAVLGDSVKDQKISQFYNYPELVAIRTEMRAVLSRDIVRMKKVVN